MAFTPCRGPVNKELETKECKNDTFEELINLKI